MNYIWIILTAFIIGIAAILKISAEPVHVAYKKGDKIKQYRMLKDNGSFIDTEELKGHWIIFYFYPKDDTPGCTKEAQTFSSLLDEFTALNTMVFGINTNSPESHRKFKEKYSLKVTLLSDKLNIMADDFDIKVIGGLCSRDTVLINPEGKIEEVFRGVNPAGHPSEILEYIKNHSEKNL